MTAEPGCFLPVAGESVLLDGPRTFLALAAVGFMKLIPVPAVRRAAAAVLGTVLVPRAAIGRADGVADAVTTEVRREPFLEVPLLLVTELLEALELDLLRFSLELLVRPLVVVGLVLVMLLRTVRRLFIELEFCKDVLEGLDLLMVGVDLRMDLGDSVLLPSVDLLSEREEALMLLLLPPFILDMGFRSPRPEKAVLLFLGLTRPLLGITFSSLFFIRFLVISLERSLILLKVPLGLSGGRLVALEDIPLLVRLELEPRVSRLGLELVRLVLLPDFPAVPARRLTTLGSAFIGSRCEPERDSRSIKEFLRPSGFFRSLRE